MAWYLDWERKKFAFSEEIRATFPGLSNRTVNSLRAAYIHEPDGLRAIKAASDGELRAIHQFGAGSLAEFRSVWPEPVREGTEIVPALPCTESHGPLSWVGG